MERAASKVEQPGITALTSGLAKGEEQAFRQFHAAYFNRLLRYLFVITRGDEHAAREALQETMTRVVRYARRFNSEETFWSWLTVLARSAAVDGGRKRQRYWRLIRTYALWWIPQSDGANKEADAYLEQLLPECMEGLDEMERALVEKKYLQGNSTRELALEYGLTERAVESRLLRARRELRQRLLKRLKDEKEF